MDKQKLEELERTSLLSVETMWLSVESGRAMVVFIATISLD